MTLERVTVGDGQQPGPGHVNRREFVKGAGALGVALGGATLLSACGSSSGSAGSSTTPGTSTGSETNGPFATPKKGGTLRVGMGSAGSIETFDPSKSAGMISSLNQRAVFDPLVRFAPKAEAAPGILVEWTPNADATVWDLKLRDGVTWHDGKPVTADDLVYTLRWYGDPMNVWYSAVAGMRLNELRKMDKLTVRVPLKTANGRLQELFLASVFLLQDGTKTADFKKPVGTGPYVFEAFTPGRQSSLTANRDYWDSPRPYPDRLEILSIADDAARLNALKSGEIHICSPVSAAAASAQDRSPDGSWTVALSKPAVDMCIGMNYGIAPFTDERARLAIKLLAARPALVQTGIQGLGDIANDMLGQGRPLYNTDIPQREQDIEQAKSLLKAAGLEDYAFTLQAAPYDTGQVESATAFVQQAKEAGINMKLKVETVAAFTDPTLLYGNIPLYHISWPGASLQSVYGQAYQKDSGYNDTKWAYPGWDAMVARAVAETDAQKAQELWNELQKIQHDKGTYAVWGRKYLINGYAPNVAGFGNPDLSAYFDPDDHSVYNWGLSS